jgi:hypothetical protein
MVMSLASLEGASVVRIRSLPTVAPSTDTGKRILNGQIVEVYGTSLDEEWIYVSAPQGQGWAWHDFFTFAVGTPVIPDSSWPARPHGLIQIRDTFGEHCSAEAMRGTVEFPDSLALSWDQTVRVHRFVCHPLVAPVFQSFFDEVYRRGLWAYLHNEWGGCYNCRVKRGTSTKISTHSWGIAFDISTTRNGFNRVPTLDERIVRIGRDHQLVWGGDWSTPDGMHWQFATGY